MACPGLDAEVTTGGTRINLRDTRGGAGAADGIVGFAGRAASARGTSHDRGEFIR